MSKKQWYICMENKKDFSSRLIVQYCETKQEASSLAKKVKSLLPKNDVNDIYIDYINKNDVNKGFNLIHGNMVKKVDNVLDYIYQ